MPGEHVSPRWAQWRDDVSLEEYHERWARRAADGQSTHGEADLIEHYAPRTVLDAGCGMGRVAIELARRGLDVVGVDLDDDLLAYARADAPEVEWRHADLAVLDLARTFDVVAMPGNVMLFCAPESRGPIVAALTRHLADDGLLVAGFSTDPATGGLSLAEYDSHCAAAGLVLHERFSTWERAAVSTDGRDGYAVSVHRRG